MRNINLIKRFRISLKKMINRLIRKKERKFFTPSDGPMFVWFNGEERTNEIAAFVGSVQEGCEIKGRAYFYIKAIDGNGDPILRNNRISQKWKTGRIRWQKIKKV